MSTNRPQSVTILKGVTRVPGTIEGEALVTTEKLSHLGNAVDAAGVVRMAGHPLMGQSYAGKIIVYDTDIFSTGGAWGLFFKSRVTGCGPLALICRTVHPISVGGAVDAGIPAVDGLDQDPCVAIKTGDRVRITALAPGADAVVEVYPQDDARPAVPPASGRAGAARPGTWTADCLELTADQTAMLEGRHGKACQVAMERLVAFGQGMGAARMVPIRSAHVFSDWKTHGLALGAWPVYEEFAAMGARVSVPTTVESTFVADELVDDPGMPWHFKTQTPAKEAYAALRPVHEALQSMGVHVIPTCIPYMHLTVPRFGECHVTSESNHAAYANTMIGARVNRDPANMALYAAIVGCIPEYGMHLAENRRGELIFEVEPEVLAALQDVGDYVALGGVIGLRAVDRVPVVLGIDHMTNAQAKAFCACVSPALTYPMIHVVGVTPEARTLEEAFGGHVPPNVERIRVRTADLRALYHGVRQTERRDIDMAVIGCPFLTLDELAELADELDGKTVATRLWLYTDFVIFAAARKAGIIARLERSGARVVHSCCPGMVDRSPADAESLVCATDSLKVAHLMAGMGWPRNWLGSRREVLAAALTGRFERSRWG